MKKNYSLFRLLLPVIFMLQPIFLFSQSNQYLHFDGEDDYVLLDGAGQYVTGSSELTIAGWFYCDDLGYGQGYMGFRAGSGDGEFYLIQLNNGVMECRLVTTAGFHQYVAPENTAIPGIWQHIAWVYDGSAIKLYSNGALVGSSPASGQFSNPNVGFAIGKSMLGGYNFVFGGRIDEISVWNRGLTQDEIQDMMDNELTGTEENLQLYYKFNQGEPGGNNTSITHLICEIGNGERDAELFNFALTGETSNFNGTLNAGYQAISFPQIPNHLTTDPPIELEATATSGLDVLFELISGPATLDGNILTLTGDPGEVVVEATQPGNAQFDPADPVQNSFMVLDPNTHVPDIDVRCPLAGDVYVPQLSQIQLATIATIEYPELFNVQTVQFDINGETVVPKNYYNGHYVGWWLPPGYGNYTLTITATNNFGAAATETVDINIVQTAPDLEVQAVQGVWLNPSTPSVTVEAELPSFLGAYNQIIGTLEVQCPAAGGGCGEWDRVASVDARGHDGEWIEIIRYITPYGVPCSHTIDLTDYVSLLQGKVDFRVNCGTLDNGYDYYLTLNYTHGTPAHFYSRVQQIWQDYYPFGDYAELQPVDNYTVTFKENSVAAKLKLVSTGHGWGDLNTDNAAEFYEATHHIYVNGEETFEQYNWYTCNPNPDGCQPQNGTWYYNRAGWCPGSIAQWFDFDMTPYVQMGDVELQYLFYQDYIDYCHPNYPDCVTGVTCADCDAGFNPALAVACNLVTWSDEPIIITDAEDPAGIVSAINVSPNPTKGIVEVSTTGMGKDIGSVIEIYSVTGELLQQFEWNGSNTAIDMSDYHRGVYVFKIDVNGKKEIKKIIKQ